MAYFVYDSSAHALNASELRWVGILGRPKNPADVTTYAWPVFVGLNGQAAVDASQFPTATPSSIGLVGPFATLPSSNWPSLILSAS